MASAGGRGSTRHAGGLRAALVIGEVAAAVLLLSGAGLLVRTLSRSTASIPVFRAERLLTLQLGLPLNRYATQETLSTFYQSAEREMAAIPGVTARRNRRHAAARRLGHRSGLHHRRRPAGRARSRCRPRTIKSSARTTSTRSASMCCKGATFTEQDDARATPVCIVSEEFVRRYLGGPRSDRHAAERRHDGLYRSGRRS